MAFADTGALMSDALNRYEDVQGWWETATTGGIALDEVALGEVNADMDFAIPGVANAIALDRASAAAGVSAGAVQRVMRPILRQFGADTSHPKPKTASLRSLWRWLFDYMVSNSDSVKRASITFDTSWSADGGNLGGAPAIYRVTTDEDGFPMEGWTADTYTLECVQDSRTGTQPGQEVWTLSGTDAPIDNLEEGGSGLLVEGLSGKTAKESASYLRNPSFDSFTSAAVVGTPAAPTAVSGWTVNSAWSNFEITLDDTFRDAPGAATSAALKFTANDRVSQNLVTTRKVRLDPDLPYLVALKVKRLNSCDGTLTVRLSGSSYSGGLSNTLDMTSFTNNTWTRLVLVASPGANNWPANFSTADLTLYIDLSSNTTGEAVVDDIDFFPFDHVGGQEGVTGRGTMGTYIVISGAGGGTDPAQVGDKHSATDTGGTSAVNQKWLKKGGLGYLPSDASTPTIADS